MNDNNIIISTTQDHLEIENIIDDVVILKNNAASIVLQVSAINFGLLSEEEQDATIYAYAGLLNSLSFPIQIIIRSDKKDISGYLEALNVQAKKLKDPVLQDRMKQYKAFIENTIVEQHVLDKKFFVVIPYQQITLKAGANSPDLLEKAKTDLEPKREHLIKQFARIGLIAEQLNSQSLLKLYHQYYNPGSKGQKFASAQDYAKPLVAPNIEGQTSNNPGKEDKEQLPPKIQQPTPNTPAGNWEYLRLTVY